MIPPFSSIISTFLNPSCSCNPENCAVAVAAPYGTGEWHLYNVVADPGETHDLAGDMPALLQELQAAWDEYAEDVGVVLSE